MWFALETSISSENEFWQLFNKSLHSSRFKTFIQQIKFFEITRKNLYKQESDSFLPGYALVQVQDQSRARILSSFLYDNKIGKLVNNRGRPTPIPEEEVKKFEGSIQHQSKSKFKRGALVIFINGIWEGFTGKIKKHIVDDVIVSVHILKEIREVRTDIYAIKILDKE